jgi:hypothetical protein
MELYLHSPNTSSWRGTHLKKAKGQLYLYYVGFGAFAASELDKVFLGYQPR